VDQIRLGPAKPPSFADGPNSAAVFGSKPVTLSAWISGGSTAPFVYRWYRVGSANPIFQSYTVYDLSFSLETVQAGQYYVTASNLVGVATSPVATLVAVPAGAANQPSLTRLPNGATQISWVYGTLESAAQLEGPWVAVPGAVSPTRCRSAAPTASFG
jgi:hypothetical protein